MFKLFWKKKKKSKKFNINFKTIKNELSKEIKQVLYIINKLEKPNNHLTQNELTNYFQKSRLELLKETLINSKKNTFL